MPLESVKVLLVEDDEDDFVITRDLFREIPSARFDIEWIPEPSAALQKLLENRHDVCLVDYRLGATNGVEFIAEANQRGVEAPIILLTGQGDWNVDLAAMEAGAADFLTKSHITPALLERVIRYSIQQKRSERNRLRLLREQAARREAEAANRAKDEFIAMLSHELRTPLNAIMGWVQLLRCGGLDPAGMQQAIETIERNAKLQSRLIEDLLDISRIQSGKVRLERVPVRLSSVVEAAVNAVRPSAEARSLLLEQQIEDVGIVIGDATRLQQVASNLLNNAIKFTPETGRITVGLLIESGNARLTIADTGQGIEPSFLPFVFDRFRQGDNETQPQQKGLGLGLAIVRQLVEMHGGHVHADSKGKGTGSTFTVLLPLARGDVKASSQPAPETESISEAHA